MDIDFLTFDKRHPLGESATGVIAHFSGSLASLFLVVEVQSTSSSRLVREPEKCTLTPVQRVRLDRAKPRSEPFVGRARCQARVFLCVLWKYIFA